MQNPLIEDLIQFINESPTAWHAVATMKTRLTAFGFTELLETDEWNLQPGQAYFTCRNGSSLCAFVAPIEALESSVILGSHTDSPALKLKPNSQTIQNGSLLLGTEVYGGPTLPSWFNRELSLAGRIITETEGRVESHLVHFSEPLAIIPHLAIHLESSLGNEHKVHRQNHLPALLAVDVAEDDKADALGELLKSQVPHETLLASELFLVPSESAQCIGLEKDLISSYRLDNLLAVHANLDAFIGSREASSSKLKVFVAWDNEECGSETAQGAASTFLPDVLDRIGERYELSRSDSIRFRQRSLLISNDAAHAVHPNYADKHEPKHQPKMNAGPVIKINAQQRYASDADSVAHIVRCAKQCDVPLQYFVVRSDSRCGSTIGPISASRLGIKTVDLGAPILSMHAARELGACTDHLSMRKLMESCL